ncbi:hypothetical protein BO83DRAFT_426601 [Aspergillus eucalypticola CBS 122712]|uniref:Uncharacterized protein n=1 Tax=Aspergillus eucalypticola (strain CBS 122712 / IBT 29274) TaxID=1448314 RepID=A0A317VM70_ASPEC|nr:uncharacterized protein BO83DRAFT_426601 [Aspergillus eucalypticola CBS 122712]PWY73942.1 hypothetical protein BO83DRAFT_426601 [Aspergillus eucalypticola CBS 122712]
MEDKTIAYGIAIVGPGADKEKPAKVYDVEQKKWSNFDVLNTSRLDLSIKNKHPIVVDATFIPDALKKKITVVPNRKNHDFRAVKTAPGVGPERTRQISCFSETMKTGHSSNTLREVILA